MNLLQEVWQEQQLSSCRDILAVARKTGKGRAAHRITTAGDAIRFKMAVVFRSKNELSVQMARLLWMLLAITF